MLVVCLVLFVNVSLGVDASSQWVECGNTGFSFSIEGGSLENNGTSRFDWEYYHFLQDGDSKEVKGQYVYREGVSDFSLSGLKASGFLPLTDICGYLSLDSQLVYLKLPLRIVPRLDVHTSCEKYDYLYSLDSVTLLAYGKEYHMNLQRLDDGSYFASFLGVVDSGIDFSQLFTGTHSLVLNGHVTGYSAIPEDYVWASTVIDLSFDVFMGYEDTCAFKYQVYDADLVTGTDLKTETDKLENTLEEQKEIQAEQSETQKNIFSKMSEFFGSFFQNLIDSVIGLFVPSEEEMSELFDRLMTFFRNTFGFLFYPFDMIYSFVSLFSESSNSATIIFPGFSFGGYTIWEQMYIDLNQYEVVGVIFEYVRMITGAILSFGFIKYLRAFYDKRFGGGGK